MATIAASSRLRRAVIVCVLTGLVAFGMLGTSAGAANQDYLQEIGATAVLYGDGVADRVRAAAGGRVEAVFDVAGKTPVEELLSLVPEPSQVVSIANFTAGQAGARVTGGGADSRPMEAMAMVADLLARNKLPDTFTASPAISNGRIYLRGWEALYAVQQEAK